MATSNKKRIRKAVRVLGEADVDLATLAELSASIVDSQNELLLAMTEMQEMQMSFNRQYLRLQQAMQQQNRQCTALSNIMKTKHDTVTNLIRNIR